MIKFRPLRTPAVRVREAAGTSIRQVIVNPGSERLRARTVAIPDPGNLERFLVPGKSQAFLRRGDGMVGIGEVARFSPDTLDAADIWWGEFVDALEHESELWGVRGVGPVAFGSFTFDPDHTSEPSSFVVPQVIIGRRRERAWLTVIGRGDDLVEQMPEVQPRPEAPTGVQWRDGSLGAEAWGGIVGEVVELLTRGPVEKVVLARDAVASAQEPIDERWLVNNLVNTYRDCWVYLVDGLVGASPEMLVRRDGGLAASRVLAGTIRRGDDEADDALLATRLSASAKDLREHEFAVESVARALDPFCDAMNVPDAPYVLELPNVLHLATDITGVARPGSSSLRLAAALHPSAAVCGTPTHLARDLIAEVEGLDRGRYAGPVGWIDTQGDGEWAIALRGGLVRGNELHAFAGCGIVRESDPAAEVAETRAKFQPIREALGG